MDQVTVPKELLRQVLDALTESADLVRHDYESNWRHGIQTRARQLASMKEQLDQHEASIASLRNALEQPAREPFGWVKSSEIESSIRFGGSINLWRKQYDCDVPMYAAPQAQQPPRIGAGVTVEQTLEHWEHDFQNPMTPEQQADWVKREREFAASQAQQPEINQCDGCRSGQEMRGSLHIDRHGKPTMVCQASKYQQPQLLTDEELSKVLGFNEWTTEPLQTILTHISRSLEQAVLRKNGVLK